MFFGVKIFWVDGACDKLHCCRGISGIMAGDTHDSGCFIRATIHDRLCLFLPWKNNAKDTMNEIAIYKFIIMSIRGIGGTRGIKLGYLELLLK